MGSWQQHGMRAGFRLLGAVAPELAARRAFEVAVRPSLRPGLKPGARALLARAETLSVTAEGRRLQLYRWRTAAAPVEVPTRTVLLAHGWNSRAVFFAGWVEPLLQGGLDVVAFDMPAHGKSEGTRSDGMDMARAIWQVAQELGPLRAIVGHSAGAFAAAVAAAGGHLLRRGPVAVDRLVLLAPVDRPELHFQGVSALLGFGPRAHEALLRECTRNYGEPLAAFALTRIPDGWSQPTLLYHDPADAVVPFSEAAAIAAAYPNVRLVSVPGAGHFRIARAPRVLREASEFIAAPE